MNGNKASDLLNYERLCAEYGMNIANDARKEGDSSDNLTKANDRSTRNDSNTQKAPETGAKQDGNKTNESQKSAKPSEIVGTLNKAIGVLQSSGIYAFLIWLDFKKTKDGTATAAKKWVYELMHCYAKAFGITDFPNDPNTDNIKDFINNDKFAVEDIYMLKGMIQKMLTYGLYRARSFVDKTENAANGSDVKA